jgi:hypothetical protein
MAKQVLTQCYVEINTVDRSANVSKVEFEDKFEVVDMTTFGSGGAKEVLAGLESGQLGITFKNDFTFSQLDSAMYALKGTLVGVKLRASQSAVSTSNPSYQFNVLVEQWKPLGSATPGAAAEVDVSWTMSGTVTRTTQ